MTMQLISEFVNGMVQTDTGNQNIMMGRTEYVFLYF
jgi:hypothetical protein